MVAVACSASWSVGLRDAARPLRPAALLAVAVLALGIAGARRRASRLDGLVAVSAAAFLAVAAVSAVWSIDPRHTLARWAAFAIVIGIGAGLAVAYEGDAAGRRRILAALVAGATAVALLGVGVVAVSHADAVQAATGSTGARFRGIGQNPNTTAMLYAVALPLAVHLGVQSRGRARVLALAAAALLAGSIAASGSRGAAAAAAAAVLVYGAIGASGRAARLAAVAAVLVLGVALLAAGAVARPLSAAEAARSAHPSGSPERRTPNDAEYMVRLQDEIGYSGGSPGRSWLRTSGRVEAWRGALGQAADRPVAGYGFGTEEEVFVDRYQSFQGGVPENSFIGLLLQVGAAGVAAFLALCAALVAAAVRFVGVDRSLGAALLAVFAAGFVLAFAQSYVVIVGNTAMLTVWICAWLPAARSA